MGLGKYLNETKQPYYRPSPYYKRQYKGRRRTYQNRRNTNQYEYAEQPSPQYQPEVAPPPPREEEYDDQQAQPEEEEPEQEPIKKSRGKSSKKDKLSASSFIRLKN